MTTTVDLTDVQALDADGQPTRGNWTVAVDLGQSADWTAIGVIERPERFVRWYDPGSPDSGAEMEDVWLLRHLARVQLGTPYTEVVAQVGRLLDTPELAAAHLVVDATGVGRAVVDLFDDAHRRGECGAFWPRRLTITAGREANGWNVPKRDLVAKLQAAVQSRRLIVADGIPLADVLRREMLAFRVKVSQAGHDTYEAAREGDHDDVVLAVAMGIYWRHYASEPRVIRAASR